MKLSYPLIAAGTALAAGLVLYGVQARAALTDQAADFLTNPGFNPDTGQINPGVALPIPSSASPVSVPTPAAARAALMTRPQGSDQQPPPQQADTTSPAPANPPPQAAGGAASGPVGSTPQTMPSTLSSRNATLDRVPLMALPLGLNDEQRRRIYDSVMKDKNSVASDPNKLAPASALSIHQALDEMHPLPQTVGDIALVRGLKYVKTSNTVFLVEPATRTVVAQIEK